MLMVLDDRHDEDSFNELQHNQQENHLDNEPIHKDDKLSSEKDFNNDASRRNNRHEASNRKT